MTSPRPKVCLDAATLAEDLFELVETRDGSEYVLVEELRKEKDMLNAFDYVGISRESVRTKKDVVTRSKSLRNTLETAVATSQGMIRCLEQELEDACDLEERITSMCGLASLPTELLGRIFHFAIEINRGSILAINISHVCRLFREVTIHTPSLWSTIDVVYSEYESTPSLAILNACLERSKNSPLYIHIKFGEADDSSSRNVRSKKCLSALIQHSFRWSSFELELEVVDSQTYLQLLQDFVNINTPNLLELKIDSVTPWMYGESEQKSLASTWNAPKLQRFHVVNQYPFPSDQSVDLANIKEAHIRFDYGGVWDQDRFLGSLSRLSSLSELNLEIGDTVPFYLEEEIPPVSLNTVQIYRVGLYHIDGFDDLLSLRVLGVLRCPSARHLSLIIYRCCNSIIVPTLSILSPSFNQSSLTDLTFTISSLRQEAVSVIFQLPLDSAQNLRELSLSISSDFEISLPRPVFGNPLKTLRFSNPYPKSVARWLRSFTGRPTEEKNWPLFETFIFESLPAQASSRNRMPIPTDDSQPTTMVLQSEDALSWCHEILNPNRHTVVAGAESLSRSDST